MGAEIQLSLDWNKFRSHAVLFFTMNGVEGEELLGRGTKGDDRGRI